jgi:hypothetical protein
MSNQLPAGLRNSPELALASGLNARLQRYAMVLSL